MEELIQLFNDLKANRIEKEYIVELRNRLKSLEEQLSEIELRKADLETQLQEMDEEKTEDLQVFSPFANSPKQISFRKDKERDLENILNEKQVLDESISYLKTKLEEHTYVFDYIVNLQKKSEELVNRIIDANSEPVEESTSADVSEQDNGSLNDEPIDEGFNGSSSVSLVREDFHSEWNPTSGVFDQLQLIHQIILSDPMRAKIQLEEILKIHT